MRLIRAALTLALSTIVTPAMAGDPVAGAAKAEPCAACHGEKGVPAAPIIPSLAGQRDPFLQWQLVFFRSGRRPDPIMGPVSEPLTDEDIRDLGAYFAQQPEPPPIEGETFEPAVRKAGAEIAAAHRCAACHTDSFAGNRAAPSIVHQPRDYLVKALSDYRSSARPSVGVAAMTEAAASLSDDEIASLAAFLAAYK